MAPINQIQFEAKAMVAAIAKQQQQIASKQVEGQVIAQRDTLDNIKAAKLEDKDTYYSGHGFEQFSDKKKDKYLQEICDKFIANPNKEEVEAYAQCPKGDNTTLEPMVIEPSNIESRSPMNGPGYVSVDIYCKPMTLPTIDWEAPAETDSTIIIREEPKKNPEDFNDGKFHQFAPTKEEKKKNKHLAEICDKFLIKPTPEEIEAYAKCPGQAPAIEGSQTAALAVVADAMSNTNTGATTLPPIAGAVNNNTTLNSTTSYQTGTRYNHHNILQNRAIANAFTPQPTTVMPFATELGLVIAVVALICIILGIVFHSRRQKQEKSLPLHKSEAAFDFGVEGKEEEKPDYMYEWQPQGAPQWKSGWREGEFGVWGELREEEKVEWETQTLRAPENEVVEIKMGGNGV